MTTQQVWMMDATDVEICDGETAAGTVPSAEVTWPDGRVDDLPHRCLEADVMDADVIGGGLLLRIGEYNEDAHLGGYRVVALGQIGTDVYYGYTGDVDDETKGYYLRGVAEAVAGVWIGGPATGNLVTPWQPAFLTMHYGLLHGVPREDGHYGAGLFDEDANEDWHSWLLAIEDHTPPDVHAAVVAQLEDAGYVWPKAVAAGQNPETRAWTDRLNRWRNSLRA